LRILADPTQRIELFFKAFLTSFSWISYWPNISRNTPAYLV